MIPVAGYVTTSADFQTRLCLFPGRDRKRIAICVVHIAAIRIRCQPVRASQARPPAQHEVAEAERPRPGIRHAVQRVQRVVAVGCNALIWRRQRSPNRGRIRTCSGSLDPS